MIIQNVLNCFFITVTLRSEYFPHNPYVCDGVSCTSLWGRGLWSGDRSHDLWPWGVSPTAADAAVVAGLVAPLLTSLWVGCLCVWSLPAVTGVRDRFTSSPAALRHQQIEAQSSSQTPPASSMWTYIYIKKKTFCRNFNIHFTWSQYAIYNNSFSKFQLVLWGQLILKLGFV